MPTNPDEMQSAAELKARLKVFALIMRLGREAFEQTDLKSSAVHIVNNTRSVLPCLRSTLLDMRRGGQNPEILAQYAQIELNPHSEHAETILALARGLEPSREIRELSPENTGKIKPGSKAETALNVLTEDNRHLLIVPLHSIRRTESEKTPFLWILEFDGAVPQSALATIGLLGGDYGNALWSHTPAGHDWKKRFGRYRMSPGMFLLILGGIFILSLFLVRLEHNIAADFVVCPQSVFHSYAWFDSVVKRCHAEDGANVEKGDTILEYDTDRMRFQLAAAEAAFKEASADYEQESLTAFTDRERLGKLKILALKREQASIVIKEAQWYLEHSIVKAPVSGTLALTDGQSDKLIGRALRTGEKQFDILGGDGMVAEVLINEKDASVLKSDPGITLFLHTSPELPIPASILSIRDYPELTEQNTYCYVVRVKPEREVPGLRYGMRGVARVRGERVSLGYYLFRSLVLWWRGV